MPSHTAEICLSTVSNPSNLIPDPHCQSDPRTEVPTLRQILIMAFPSPPPYAPPPNLDILQMFPDTIKALHHSLFPTLTAVLEIYNSPTHPLRGASLPVSTSRQCKTPRVGATSEPGRLDKLEKLRETLYLGGTPLSPSLSPTHSSLRTPHSLLQRASQSRSPGLAAVG